MADKLSPNDIERLRRSAKKTARDTGITHINALDQSANKLGFPNWAAMQHHLAAAPVRHPIFLRSFEEMRVLLPYALEPVDHKFLLVGRDYKRLGRARRDERVEYGACPNLHLDLPREAISRALPHSGAAFGYLYGDSPALGKIYARKYLRRLEALIEVAKQHESVSGH